MNINPALKRLGYDDTARLVIIHCDDIGMCQATIPAYNELMDFGLISSAAVMVPCGWFMAATEAVRQRNNPDVGVHLTLTSEWTQYRWGPISTREPASGMMDAEGYFYRSEEQARKYGDTVYVKAELQAQIGRAKAMGMVPTHVDTHMGTVFHQKFLSAYVEVARENRLALFLLRGDEADMHRIGIDPATATIGLGFVAQLEAEGYPLIDQYTWMPLDSHFNVSERLEEAKRLMANVPAGITHFILHPCKDTPELRAMAPDWPARVGDYEVFKHPELRKFLDREGIQIIQYRDLQNLLPQA